MVGTSDLSIIGTDIYGNFAEEKVIEFIKNRKVT